MESLIANSVMINPLIKASLKILDNLSPSFDNDKYDVFVNTTTLYINFVFIIMYIYAFAHLAMNGYDNSFYHNRKIKLGLSIISLIVGIIVFFISYSEIQQINQEEIDSENQENNEQLLMNLKYVRLGIFLMVIIYKIYKIFSSGKKVIKGVEYSSLSKKSILFYSITGLITMLTNSYELYLLSGK